MNTKFKKIIKLLKYLFITLPFEKNDLRFIAHNKKTWSKEASSGDGEILVEVYPVASSIISQSYLANRLAKKFNAKIMSYTPSQSTLLKRIYNFRYHRIYRSFNTSDFFYIDFRDEIKNEAHKKSLEIIKNLKTKKEAEDLAIDGVWIGDLLYDSHSMNYRVPAVDLADPRFFKSLERAVSYYLFWKNYFDTHKVKAAIVSHCVYYENGIITRICYDRGIPCYQVSAASCYYVHKSTHDRAYREYLLLPERFKRLTPQQQEEGLAIAKNRLDMRFSGKVGVDMHYSSKSAYGNKKAQRLIRESNKIKILIAPHCFFDSPHPFGNNVFPDFYDWLNFLGKISERTDYDWYIKTHPDYLPDNIPVINELVSKYPKFTLIPPDSSHNQIIEEGINFALTVFGTIGVEYAARGLPVINASINNPHYAYTFNRHISSIPEYEQVLMNLKDFKHDIDKKQTYEYYYMYHLNRPDSWLYNDYKTFIKHIGGYNKESLSVAYSYFLDEFNEQKHKDIIHTLDTFIDSKEYYLDVVKQKAEAAQMKAIP